MQTFASELPYSMDDDLTVLEFTENKAPVSQFYLFLTLSHYPSSLSLILREFFQEVRLRMIESRDYDRIHYPNTLYQKFYRLLRKIILQVKNNLNS